MFIKKSFFSEYFLFFLLLPYTGICQNTIGAEQAHFFIENKGQLKDQYGKPRKDIDYVLQGNAGMQIFIGAGQIAYQMNNGKESYRLDLLLDKINKKATRISDAPQDYYETHYDTQQKKIIAKSYQRIVYQNIYKGIDWVLYTQNGNLEYEFVVSQKADAALIQMHYEGATKIAQMPDGSIVATTPMGEIHEAAPLSYSAEGKLLGSSFVLQQQTLRFDVTVQNRNTAYVIDPSLSWATYYGADIGFTRDGQLCTDGKGYLYFTGYTSSATNIATVGSHQNTLSGSLDAFIAKFDSSGKRIWATYFGSEQSDLVGSVKTDAVGNIYLVGAARGYTGIATSGAHKTSPASINGGAFIAKFKPDGSIVWGTYYGGITSASVFSTDIFGVCLDAWANVYIYGNTNSENEIATVGTHKSSYTHSSKNSREGFIAKFDSSGKMLWGTYYGGEGVEDVQAIVAKGTKLYAVGNTRSKTGIATTGAFKTTLNSSYDSTDAFITCFDSAGKQLWGTYYGGNKIDVAYGIAMHPQGHLYISGHTDSDSAIATKGAWQDTLNVTYDVFLLKMDTTGKRIWCTYSGGESGDGVGRVAINKNPQSDVYILGSTLSKTGISTLGAFMPIQQGDQDVFWASYNTNGQKIYGSYYGGNKGEIPNNIIIEGNDMYLYGNTTSNSGIATAGSFRPSFLGSGGIFNVFVAKFSEVYPSTIPAVATGAVSELKVYPNPSNGQFTLTGSCINSNAQNLTLSILNPVGKVVMSENVKCTNGQLQHNFQLYPTLPNGVYFATISNGTFKETIKIVKE